MKPSVPWKKWKHIGKHCCTGHSVFLFLTVKVKCCCSNEPLNKYHSGGLWTNACCSHPHPGEETDGSSRRRLKEEMGFSTDLEKIFDFTYKAAFENGLTEYEFDHVFAGSIRWS